MWKKKKKQSKQVELPSNCDECVYNSYCPCQWDYGDLTCAVLAAKRSDIVKDYEEKVEQ